MRDIIVVGVGYPGMLFSGTPIVEVLKMPEEKGLRLVEDPRLREPLPRAPKVLNKARFKAKAR